MYSFEFPRLLCFLRVSNPRGSAGLQLELVNNIVHLGNLTRNPLNLNVVSNMKTFDSVIHQFLHLLGILYSR